MQINISTTREEAGRRAALDAAGSIREALDRQDHVTLVLATGVSQLDMLSHLLLVEGIDWSRIDAFHLDEYIGIPSTHPASFRGYLEARFVNRLPLPLRNFHPVQGDAPDPRLEVQRLNDLINGRRIDLTLAGIGENGHLAFNDPPADFSTTEPYLEVELDEACRRQQFGEGWFASLDEVPTHALSMSVHQILASEKIIITCCDTRKAEAVKAAFQGPVTPAVPASALQGHQDVACYLDCAAASLLRESASYAVVV